MYFPLQIKLTCAYEKGQKAQKSPIRNVWTPWLKYIWHGPLRSLQCGGIMSLSSSSRGLLVSASSERCPLSGSLRQLKACFCLTKYLASIFTVLWLNKVPFNSLIYGYAYPMQIITFHNNLWQSECTGIVCINLHLCVFTCTCAWVIAVDKQFIITTCSATASMQKEPCASSSRLSRYHLQWCVTTAHVWVEAIPIL